MSDRIQATTNDHPLRETFLAFVDEEQRNVLVPAAALLERAILEYVRGPGAIPLQIRLAQAVDRDLCFLLDHLRESLRGWDVSPDTPPKLREALERAIPHLTAAHRALAPAVEATQSDRECR